MKPGNTILSEKIRSRNIMSYILFYRIKKQVKLNALLFRNKKPHEKTFKNAGGGF